MRAPSSWVGDLKRQARFAQFLPLFGPGVVHFAFRVVSSGVGAGELNRIHAAEVAYLVALGLQPDVLDAGDFSGHRLDSSDRLFLIHFRDGWLPFVYDYVQNRFRLAESVLRRRAPPVPVTKSDSR